jgi:C1A family cysteine protease
MSNQRIDLDELAVSLKAQGSPWRSGETSMTKLSEAEVKRRLGFVPPPGAPSLQEVARASRSGRPQEPFTAAAALGAPPAYDLRNVGGQSYVTGIRDQGGCGSCVAFGVVAVLESTLRVSTGNPNLDADLSEAHLFYCHGRKRGRRCSNGWWPEEALDDCRDNGLALEQS